MPPPIPTTLTALLPTHTPASLPAALTSLAASLLTQSHTAAPALKPDEEIARTFACCHLAIERLAGRVPGVEVGDLGKVNAPCGPRVYGRLKGYFGGVLKGGLKEGRGGAGEGGRGVEVKGKGRGRGKAVRESAAWKERAGEVGEEGKKVGPVAGERGSVSAAGKRKRVELEREGEEAVVPEYVGKALRWLCTELETPDAMPHIFAGMREMLLWLATDGAWTQTIKKRKASYGKVPPQKAFDNDVVGLILALWVDVSARMYGWGDESREQEERAERQIIKYAARDSVVELMADSPRSEAARMRKETDNEWLWKDEWYLNVPLHEQSKTNHQTEGANLDEQNDENLTPAKKRTPKTPLRRKDKYSLVRVDDDDAGRAGLLPGLGTMFQPAFDWLSEERMDDFAEWREEMLREVVALVSAAPSRSNRRPLQKA